MPGKAGNHWGENREYDKVELVLLCQIIPIPLKKEKNATKPQVIGFCNNITVNMPRPECRFPASFSPVPLRLNRPTGVEQIVGPIKRSGSGNRAGESRNHCGENREYDKVELGKV